MDRILEIKQKRAGLVNQARALLTQAETENRDLTAEENEQYERMMADVDRLGKDVERLENLQRLEDSLRDGAGPTAPTNPQDTEPVPLRASKEYREAFWAALKTGKNGLTAEQYNLLMAPEIRNLAIGTDAAGGYLVPDEFERQLIQALENENIMRQLATVITTGSGTREIPVEVDYGTATWLGENAAYTESDATFGQKTLSAYKLGTIIKVSEELLADSAFDIDGYVTNAFARRFGRAEEEAFIVGDGSNKPTGLVGAATEGVTGAAGQTTAITAEDLIDLFHALKRPYRANAVFLLADSTAKAIRKLKDGDDQFLWQPGLQAGQPDRILSRPVYISDDVPEMAASARSVVFGDLSYYWIADRAGRAMQRLAELYAATGQVGYRMYSRVDGNLILPEAVVVYKNAAS